jgi:hypothetical protein
VRMLEGKIAEAKGKKETLKVGEGRGWGVGV